MPTFETPQEYQRYIESDKSGWQWEQSEYDKGNRSNTDWRDRQSAHSRNSGRNYPYQNDEDDE